MKDGTMCICKGLGGRTFYSLELNPDGLFQTSEVVIRIIASRSMICRLQSQICHNDYLVYVANGIKQYIVFQGSHLSFHIYKKSM